MGVNKSCITDTEQLVYNVILRTQVGNIPKHELTMCVNTSKKSLCRLQGMFALKHLSYVF